MTTVVTVVDYGLGNLFSVRRAIESCGGIVEIADNPQSVLTARRLVLPGVGAFADGMAGLHARNLSQAIVQYANSGRPLLGICLGMQMLLSHSKEFGEHVGLGIIPGRVEPIPRIGRDGESLKVPFVGWNSLQPTEPNRIWDNTILRDLQPGNYVYLVHSFMAVPWDPGHRLADCIYGGNRIAAVVRRDNVYGCQFHPEKSGGHGLSVIRAFLSMREI